MSAAAELTDREGAGALTLSRLADQLGVRPPSLYSHVDGLDGLRREVALRAIEQLGEETRTAVMGSAGVDGLRRMAEAYRRFAVEHPGVYPLTQQARPDDEEHARLAFRALEPLLSVLASLGYEGDEAVHRARAVRSALHGFVALETGSGFGIDLDAGDSFTVLVDMVVAGLHGPDDPAGPEGNGARPV